jgi:cation diffusion facilitator CzcD-associated flavoprotein CzcO
VSRLLAIGGSDAGISAALRARELDGGAEVTVVVADAYRNFSICGIPYYVSGDVSDWRSLAHRSVADLEATGMTLRLDTVAQRIEAEAHQVLVTARSGEEELLDYDALVIGTGAVPVRPPIDGLAEFGPDDGVHLLHSTGDTFALMRTLQERSPQRAVIVGAGYIGLEMAEALVAHGVSVTQLEQLPKVLPTVDAKLGALVHAELERHGVDVRCSTRVDAIAKTAMGSLEVRTTSPDDRRCRLSKAVSVGRASGAGIASSAFTAASASPSVTPVHSLVKRAIQRALSVVRRASGRVCPALACWGDVLYLGGQVAALFRARVERSSAARRCSRSARGSVTVMRRATPRRAARSARRAACPRGFADRRARRAGRVVDARVEGDLEHGSLATRWESARRATASSHAWCAGRRCPSPGPARGDEHARGR